MLKRIIRRVDQCWTKEKLMAEVDLGSLLLLATLREGEPALFNAFVNSYGDLVNGKPLPVAKIEDGKEQTVNDTLFRVIADFASAGKVHLYNSLFKELLNLKEDITEKSGNSLKSNTTSSEQHLGVKPSSVNYLKRILLETVPTSELRDQIAIDSIKSQSTRELAKNICRDYRWQEAFERFGRILFTDNGYQWRVEQIVFDILDCIGKDEFGFLTGGLFEEYTKQAIDNNNLEVILNKLVNLESGKVLLEKQLYRILHEFGNKTQITGKTISSIEDESKLKEASNYSYKLFQGVSISNFLHKNGHKLSDRSLSIIFKLLSYQQLVNRGADFFNKYIKNILDFAIQNKSTQAIEFFTKEVSVSFANLDILKQHFLELSHEQGEGFLQKHKEERNRQKSNSQIEHIITKLETTE